MSMFNDIEWWTKKNESNCLQNAVEEANYVDQADLTGR